MTNKFDELTKQMTQSVTRRAALKKFGVGLGAIALGCFGLANKAQAGQCQKQCARKCAKKFPEGSKDYETCYEICLIGECAGP